MVQRVNVKDLPRPSPLWTAAAIAVAIAAFLMQVLLAYPVHTYPGDSDTTNIGLCAMAVLRGERPLMFPGAYRFGALSCYVTAATFRIFGVSRESLQLPILIFFGLFFIFIYLYLKEAFGERGALIGFLLAAAPPYALMFIPHITGYSDFLMYCAAILWLATRLERGKSGLGGYLALGVAMGLALWCSMLSLMITLPVLFWLFFRKVLISPRNVTATVAGALAGASPMLLFFLRGGISKFASDTLTHPAHSLAGILPNFSYFIFTQLPLLLANKWDSGYSLTSAGGVIVPLYGVAAAILLMLSFWPGSRLRKQPELRSQVMLLGLIAFFCTVLYVCSTAGSMRGWTPRYISPLYLTIPAMAAILFVLSPLAGRVVIVAAIVFLLAMNLRDYPFPFTRTRQRLQAELQSNYRLLAQLRQNHILGVLGDYWDVYDLNFDSQGRITAIPTNAASDIFDYESRIIHHKLTWALIDHDAAHLAQWQRTLGLAGKIIRVTAERYCFVPTINPPGRTDTFLALARARDCPPVADPGDLLPISMASSGFEERSLAAWHPYQNVTAQISSERAHSGRYSLAESSGEGSMYEDVGGLEPGGRYTVSAWLSGAPGSSASGQISIYDPGADVATFSPEVKPGNGWQLVTHSVTVRCPGIIRIHLFRKWGSGTIFWDDIRVYRDK